MIKSYSLIWLDFCQIVFLIWLLEQNILANNRTGMDVQMTIHEEYYVPDYEFTIRLFLIKKKQIRKLTHPYTSK